MPRSGNADASELAVAAATRDSFDAVTQAAPPAHAFLRLAWFEAAARRPLRAITASRAGGEPLAALAVERGRFRPAQVSGSYWPFRSFPIAADAHDEEVAALLGHSQVKALLGPIWRMGPVLGDDPTATRLLQIAPRCGWTVLTRKHGKTYDLDLGRLRANGTWPRASTLSKNRWRERRLADRGEPEWRFLTGAEWTSRDLDDMAEVEANSWLARLDQRADFKFRDDARRRVWERAAADPATASMLFASILRIGGTPAAFVFGLDLGVTRHIIANNFDERFARHAPGKVLLYRDFARAADRGVTRIQWGTGDAGYKSEMGAVAGAEVHDLLFVRQRLLAAALRPLWR